MFAGDTCIPRNAATMFYAISCNFREFLSVEPGPILCNLHLYIRATKYIFSFTIAGCSQMPTSAGLLFYFAIYWVSQF